VRRSASLAAAAVCCALACRSCISVNSSCEPLVPRVVLLSSGFEQRTTTGDPSGRGRQRRPWEQLDNGQTCGSPAHPVHLYFVSLQRAVRELALVAVSAAALKNQILAPTTIPYPGIPL
jgi:hypothetical protein